MKLTSLALLFSVMSLLAADAPATFKAGEFTFTRPVKWEWAPASSAMRKAQLRVPAAKGDGADVVFFYFGEGGGGGTQANVDRWLNQFKDAHDKKITDGKTGTHK